MADDEETPRLSEARWRAQFEANLAHWSVEHEAKMEKWRADFEVSKMGFEAITTFSSITIRSLLILNGAAAIAILTFVGDQSKSVAGFNVKPWLPAFEVFGWGTFLAVLCSALTYLSQVFIHEPDNVKVKSYLGEPLRWLAVLAGAGSLFAFICGLYRSMAALG